MNTISQRRARATKVAVMAFLLAVCCGVLYWFHAKLGTIVVFTHLFYAPIILACLWWRSRGLVVAAFLAGMLLVSHHVFLSSATGPDEYARAGMFLVIGSVVAFLSKRIARRQRLLLEMGEHIQHLNAVLRGIRDVNQIIVREKHRDRLIQAICERLTNTRGFHGAWIVLTDHLPTSIETAQHGFGEDALSELVGVFQNGQLPSCCRRAQAESRIIVNENPSAACKGCPLADAYGGAAALSTTLEFEGQLYGYMGISAPTQFARDEEENSLLEEIAGDIAFGLYTIETEAAREKSERIVRAMLDSASDSMALADAETLRFVLVNTAMCRMLGYSQDELKEMSVRDIHPEEDLPRVVSDFEKQFRGEISLAVDIPVKRKDGAIFPADINSALVELGGRPHLLGVFRDITDRKRTEDALRETRDYAESIIDSMVGMLLVVSPEGGIATVNDATCRLLGYSEEEMIGQPASLLFEEEEKEEEKEGENEDTTQFSISKQALPVKRTVLRRLAREGFIRNIEKSLLTKGGEKIPVLLSGSVMRDDRGNISGIVCLALDISERKRAERALHDADLERSAILDAQMQHVILEDLNLRVLWPNDAACESAGMSREELIGRHCYEVWMQSATPCSGCPVLLAIQDGQPHENVSTTPDGKTWRVRGSPIRNDAGEVVRVVEVTEDITHQQHLEEQFRQAQKMEAVGQLAGGVAHDFRNQLQVIKGFGLMLLRRGYVAEEGREKMEQILEAADRSVRLTGQLLAFSHREMLRPEVIDPAEPIRDLQKSLPQMIGEDIRLLVDLGHDADCVNVDSGQFQQAIINLAVNARDAMPQGGELAIAIESVDLDARFVAPYDGAHAGKFVMISVRDTGVGMNERTRSQIFDPFFTTKEVGKGTGLGLSMAYGFVSQSNGIIICDSKPGKGTTFRMYFPIVDTPAATPGINEEAAADVRHGTGTILLVEDEEAVLRLLADTLEEAGYTVLRSEHPDAALAKLSEHQGPVDVLITDIVMPGTDGRTLAKKVTELYSGIQVLYVSGYVGEELNRRGLAAIQDSILIKPFSPEQLLDRLSEILHRPAEQ